MKHLNVARYLAPLVLSLAQFHSHALAQEACGEHAGRFASIEGRVQVRGGEQEVWHAAKMSDRLCKGDTIRVGELSRAALVLINEAVMRLDQNTTLRLVDITGKKEQRSVMELLKGKLKSFIRKPRLLSVNTPYLNGSIEGTEFQVGVDDSRSSILLLEGHILASNDQGKATVVPGEIVEASAGGQPLARTVVKPRDAVQWSLYYPPIQTSAAIPGDSVEAFAALDKVPEADRNAAHHLQRAELLLSVGRHEEAGKAIDAALAMDPNNGLAYGLRAIIHVVRNERDQALAAAEKAVSLNDTAATRIALSYAQQAAFRLEAARDSLLAATRNHPEDALAWARLSELQLMLGDKAQSRAAAAKAVSIAPDLARTQMVLGFTALAEYRPADAAAAFEQAIARSPSDPMAHLGLGLARISGGQLAAGRGELEVAVAMDSSQPLLRAYLGKAYFEEKRGPLDAQQFEIAKTLDPLDPTAYLYDGIRKQTENRPVEALADLEQSRDLNDNRAVYRGRLLLDQDQAARGTSVARIYTDLGFTELGVAEATRSLTLDPANASAHRFLADVYQGTRRREIARVSELTQAQMLQDLNLNPIQLSASEANLNIVTAGGPASAGFNEFTPLFQRNQTQFSIAGMAGNNDTANAEAALSGVYDRVSFSLGALTYDTDGWRPNNGLEQDLFNVFVQAAVSEKLNVQAEFRHRESTEGDLAFNFDPTAYDPGLKTEREQDTTRLGLRYSPSSQTHVLLSYIHGKQDIETSTLPIVVPDDGANPNVDTVTITQATQHHNKADQYEAQLLRDWEKVNLVTGVSWSESDPVNDISGSFTYSFDPDPLNPRSFAFAGQDKFPTQAPHAYVYANLAPSASTTWTLGASYDHFSQDYLSGGIKLDTYKVNGLNPKLGVQWAVRPDVLLRAAAFRVVKPALANNRTLEPTQVAGFNQLFDDTNGTRSRLYGLGADWKASGGLKVGVELTHRILDEAVLGELPALSGNFQWLEEERKETLHRLYVDWLPSPRWALHGELVYDRYRSEAGVATKGTVPEEVETWSLPMGIQYFGTSGLFGGLVATYVDQTVRRSDTAFITADGSDQFMVVDASIGYRLAKRRGVLSLAVKNLFDTSFNYQDDSYREFRDEPSIGPYFPERTLMARFMLNF